MDHSQKSATRNDPTRAHCWFLWICRAVNIERFASHRASFPEYVHFFWTLNKPPDYTDQIYRTVWNLNQGMINISRVVMWAFNLKCPSMPILFKLTTHILLHGHKTSNILQRLKHTGMERNNSSIQSHAFHPKHAGRASVTCDPKRRKQRYAARDRRHSEV